MLLAELGVSRATGPPWSTKTCAASSLPPTKSPDSTSTAKPAFASFHLPTPCPVLQSFSLLTTYLLLDSFQFHLLRFLLSVLPPFPCHFSPIKYWQGSHLFLLCSSTVPCVFWPQRGASIALQYHPLITALRVWVTQPWSSPWLKVSIIPFTRLRERREEER